MSHRDVWCEIENLLICKQIESATFPCCSSLLLAYHHMRQGRSTPYIGDKLISPWKKGNPCNGYININPYYWVDDHPLESFIHSFIHSSMFGLFQEGLRKRSTPWCITGNVRISKTICTSWNEITQRRTNINGSLDPSTYYGQHRN